MFSNINLISLEFSVNAHTMNTILSVASEIMKCIHGVKRRSSLVDLFLDYLDTAMNRQCREAKWRSGNMLAGKKQTNK